MTGVVEVIGLDKMVQGGSLGEQWDAHASGSVGSGPV